MNTSALRNPMSQRTRHGPIKVRPTKFEGKSEFVNFEDLDLASLLEPWPADVPEPVDPKAEGWRELGEAPEDPDNLRGLPVAECDARAQPLRLSRKPKRRLPWPMPFRPDAETLSVEPWMAEPFPAEMPWDKQSPKDMICKNAENLTMVRWHEYPLYDENEAETYDQAASVVDFNQLPINKPRMMARRFPKERLLRKENTTSDLYEMYETTRKHNVYQKFMLDEFHSNSLQSPKAFLKRNAWDTMKIVQDEGGAVDGEDGGDKMGGENDRINEGSEWSGRGRGRSTIGLRGAFRGRGRGGGWRDGGVGRDTGRNFNFDEEEEEEELNDEEKELLEKLGRDEYALMKKSRALLNMINVDCDLIENEAHKDEGNDSKIEM